MTDLAQQSYSIKLPQYVFSTTIEILYYSLPRNIVPLLNPSKKTRIFNKLFSTYVPQKAVMLNSAAWSCTLSYFGKFVIRKCDFACTPSDEIWLTSYVIYLFAYCLLLCVFKEKTEVEGTLFIYTR